MVVHSSSSKVTSVFLPCTHRARYSFITVIQNTFYKPPNIKRLWRVQFPLNPFHPVHTTQQLYRPTAKHDQDMTNFARRPLSFHSQCVWNVVTIAHLTVLRGPYAVDGTLDSKIYLTVPHLTFVHTGLEWSIFCYWTAPVRLGRLH